MKLLTKEIRACLPKLGATNEQGAGAIVQVKFFAPWSQWTWYAVEFDGEDVFYGYVIGLYNEFGSFRLSELESVRGPLGLGVERDLYFKPTPLKELVKD